METSSRVCLIDFLLSISKYCLVLGTDRGFFDVQGDVRSRQKVGIRYEMVDVQVLKSARHFPISQRLDASRQCHYRSPLEAPRESKSLFGL